MARQPAAAGQISTAMIITAAHDRRRGRCFAVVVGMMAGPEGVAECVPRCGQSWPASRHSCSFEVRLKPDTTDSFEVRLKPDTTEQQRSETPWKKLLIVTFSGADRAPDPRGRRGGGALRPVRRRSRQRHLDTGHLRDRRRRARQVRVGTDPRLAPAARGVHPPLAVRGQARFATKRKRD